MAIHPLLKDGMYLWVGKSPVSNKYITLQYKTDSNTEVICPADFIETAKKLGLKVVSHWNPEIDAEGHRALKGSVTCKKYVDEQRIKDMHVSPVIKVIQSGEGITNNLFLAALRRDTE